ncbi:unnamed protein product, partial [Allacma fusca]
MLRFLTFLIFLSFYALDQHASAKYYSKGKTKLPFYVLVKIPSGTCDSEYLRTSGVCVASNRACTRLNGTESGTCAMGYGICCLVTLNCATSPEVVKANGTHLVNPSNLKNQTSCEFQLPRPPGVCQVRLDFNNFNTSLGDQPFVGDCQTDTFNIVGADNTKYLGPLCGNLTGQHVYLDYGNSNTISLFNYISQAMGQTWDIKVTYIKCDSPDKAPPGCLQYYTDPSGTVKSFNFNGMQQLNNEDYTVCIKSQPGMTKITWNSCGGLNDFFITGTGAIAPPPGTDFPPITNPVSGNDCMYDWVMILGANKYCGNTFDGPVT